ncbi:YhdP family protein [soil metagenome]
MLASVSKATRFATRHGARLSWRVLRWTLWAAVALWGLMLLAWLLLQWAILPHIDDWRPALEREASRALGVQVRIGSIAVTAGGWIPALALQEVRLLDPQGREALRLPKVAAALSARSLLAAELRFSQLLIDGPELEIRRDAQGKIFIGGLSVDAAAHAETSGLAEEWADWFFVQHEFVVLHGRVRWIDERRSAPALELSDVNLVLRNSLRQHALRLDATPPPAWGQRFGLQGKFSQALLKRAGDVQHWSGQLFADLPRTDLRELRRHIDLPFELSEGDGALRAWVDIKNGSPTGATVDMGLRAVKLRLLPKADELELARVEGRLRLLREPERLSLQATQLGFVSGDGVAWPRSDWGVELKLAKDGGVAGGELRAERLDFALMAQIAERLPVGDGPRALLAELAPQGVLSALNARWDGALEAPRSYQLKARLDGLRLTARPAAAPQQIGRPGLSGASVSLNASERGGMATISIEDGALNLPGLFEEPVLPLKRLAAQLDWRITPAKGERQQGVALNLRSLRIANDDLRGEFDAQWNSLPAVNGRASPGHLELNGRIERADATRVQRYLPLSVGESARRYVKEAIRSGEARNVVVRLRGPLADFPYEANARGGVFRITAQAREVALNYVTAGGWPLLEHIDADLLFDRGSMLIQNGRARSLGFELSGVTVGIKDLIHNPMLEIDGGGRGATQELLRFMRASPVDEWTGHMLSNATSNGPAALKLSLRLPLNDINKATVKGTVQLLAGNDLRLRADAPLLGNARARIDFDRNSVQLVGGQARLLGGDAAFEGGSVAGGAAGNLRFSVQGVASAEALRRTPELGAVAKLAQAATGQAAYRLQVGINLQGQVEANLTSPLQGLALDLPAPLRKDADTVLALRLQTSMPAAGRDDIRLELGNVIQAHYLRDTSGEQARVLRGALSIQDALPALPPSGVQLSANLGTVDLDAWRSSLQRLFGAAAADTATATATEAGYMPGKIGLRAQSLLIAGRPLTKLAAGITHGEGADPGLWRFSLDAEQLSGLIELRKGSGGGGLVYARLARLSLPKQEADSVSQLLEKGLEKRLNVKPADQTPASVPALDIVIDDFELRGKKLGRLEVEANANGPARDWRLGKLRLVHPDAVLNATGRWMAEPGQTQRRTVLDWQLDVLDAGNLLDKLGQGRVLRGGKGQMAGQVGWQGSPLALDYASMAGQLNLSLDRGQFLHAEPGVGRLLGVLSLQSLPRRFLLDFRDVFAEGFAFDGIGGDVKIERGIASSSNLRMRGLQAAVLLDGRADLAAETQNLRVLVVPELNAGGAALAYAAINPAIGLGTFLAQLILSRPMAAANTREFHISGSWDDPKVEKVEHKSTPAPAAGVEKEAKESP